MHLPTSLFRKTFVSFPGEKKPSWISEKKCQGQPLNFIPLTCNDCRSTNQTQEPDIAVEVEAIERKKHIKSANVVIPHTVLNVFLQNPL